MWVHVTPTWEDFCSGAQQGIVNVNLIWSSFKGEVLGWPTRQLRLFLGHFSVLKPNNIIRFEF